MRIHFTRVLSFRAVVALGVVGVLATPTARAQNSMKDALADNATRILSTCDYAQYIQTAELVGKELQRMHKDRPLSSGGIPTMDLLTAVATGVTTVATEKQVKVESQGLVLQLEQACQTWAMARNTQRQFELAQSVAYGTADQLNFIRENLGVLVRETWNERHQETDLEVEVQDYMDMDQGYEEPDAALGAAIDSTTISAMRSARALGVFADSLNESLDALELDLSVWSKKDSVKADRHRYVICPKESKLPDLRLDDAAGVESGKVRYVGRRGWECGPASPGRATQVTAATEVLRAQLEAAQQSAAASQIEVQAAQLMQQTREHRQERKSRLLSFSLITP